MSQAHLVTMKNVHQMTTERGGREPSRERGNNQPILLSFFPYLLAFYTLRVFASASLVEEEAERLMLSPHSCFGVIVDKAIPPISFPP